MVSFVIPAHNEADYIEATVRALHRAGATLAESYEIVVVNDASTDNTGARAAAAGARVINVFHRKISATRNSGARAALGDKLIFVDADTLVPPRAAREAYAALHSGAAGGGGPVRFDGEVPLHAKLLLPPILAVYRRLRLAAGCFIFYSREVFNQTGGFDEALFASEEIAMSRAIGTCGRFAQIRTPVITSGRKLRAYTTWQLYAGLLRIALRGPRGVRQRAGLEMWYGPRCHVDPAQQKRRGGA